MPKAPAPGEGQKRLSADHLERCIAALELAYKRMGRKSAPQDLSYDILRAACVKEFEIILEQCGSLLKKRLSGYFASHKAADRLAFKDIFRHAAKRSLISPSSAERWLIYRDCRNSAAHDYGKAFAEEIIQKIPEFISDAKEVLSCFL